MEQQLQLEQMEKELQQQQELINNLEQVEVSQDQRIQDLERQNIRILGKLYFMNVKFSIDVLVSLISC